MAMMSSFDKSYDHYKKRNALQGRMVALQITLLLMLLFIFSLGLVVLGQNLLSLLFTALAIKNVFTVFLLNLLRYALILLMFFLGISLIYYYGPATKKKYRFISTGATVATALSILSFGGLFVLGEQFQQVECDFWFHWHHHVAHDLAQS
jgi:membrane protein